MKLLLTCLIVAVVALPVNAQRYIFGRSDFPVTAPVSALAVGDFNHDGHLDVVTGSGLSGHNVVSVALGKSDGTFRRHRDYAVGGIPSAIATGDFNGDGHLDLVVGNGVDTISVLLGNGDGTFQHARTIGAGKFPDSIAVGDFNGDGKLDLAVGGGRDLILLFGNGDGTFQPKQSIATGDGAIALVAGDFNHDGALDLFVANVSTSYTVLLNKGNGTFTRRQVSSPITNIIKAVAVDLNHDGNLDIVMIGQDQFSPVRVAVLLGDKRGAFHNVATYDNSYFTIDIVAGDFNRDGNPDVAVALEDGTLNVYTGDGRGNLNAPSSFFYGDGGDFHLAAGDFTGGGNVDLAVAFDGADLFSILLNRGDGSFIGGTGYAVGTAPTAIASADLNADGIPDLAVANRCTDTGCSGPGSLSVLSGNGDGTFMPAVTYAAGQEPTGVVIADFNNDGIRDIAVSNFCGSSSDCRQAGTVSIYLGQAGGSFQAPVSLPVQFGPVALASGDFNKDGNTDLAVVNACATAACSKGTVSILLGNGDGTFTPGAILNVGKIPAAVVTADFNGDGKLDLVVSNNGGKNPTDTLSLFLGKGDGTFGAPRSILTAYGPAGMAVADLNGDGFPDLLVASAATGLPPAGYLAVLIGDGRGGFQSYVPYAASQFSGLAVALGDFDADGKLDVAMATAGDVAILRGNGDGTFQIPASYPQAAGSQFTGAGIVTGDWNRDGGVDYATVNSGIPGETLVMLNASAAAISPPSLTFPPQTVGAGASPKTVRVINSSGTPLVIQGMSPAGPAAGDYTISTNCAGSLAPGASCGVAVDFKPAASGARLAVLTILSDGVGSPQVVPLSGTGK